MDLAQISRPRVAIAVDSLRMAKSGMTMKPVSKAADMSEKTVEKR